jgi:hypothetical protein
MTEADWLTSTDPQEMLVFLRDSGRASERKLRLFAVACCQRVDSLLTNWGRAAVVAAERFADGRTGHEELHVAWSAVGFPKAEARRFAASAARAASSSPSYDGTAHAAASAVNAVVARSHPTEADALRVAERMAQTSLLRDIFGNPFRPPSVIPPAVVAWNDDTVRRLAESAYAERRLPSGTLDPARLAVLADALEEAGLTDAELLQHLRGSGPHVRGCFAVDAVLGKS